MHWLPFPETTGDICGFTPTEEMNRLKAALIQGKFIKIIMTDNYQSKSGR